MAVSKSAIRQYYNRALQDLAGAGRDMSSKTPRGGAFGPAWNQAALRKIAAVVRRFCGSAADLWRAGSRQKDPGIMAVEWRRAESVR